MNVPAKPYFPHLNFLRLIIIVLLVVNHAFAPFQHAWPMPEGITEQPLYKGIAILAYSFLLPTFVFLSGYLSVGRFAHISGRHSLMRFLLRKARRLLLPTFVFGLLYQICFPQLYAHLSPLERSAALCDGVGHLWFLPMLFCCFPLSLCLQRLPLTTSRRLTLLCLLALLPLSPLPLRLHDSCYYLLFFQLGIEERRHSYFRQRVQPRLLLSLALLYLLSLLLLQPLLPLAAHHVDGYFLFLFNRLVHTLVALSGLLTIYLLICYLHQHDCLPEGPRWQRWGSESFGIYLFHQFLLWALYYHSPLPTQLGTLLLPWVALLLVLPLSLFLTRLVRTTPIGRQLT